MKLIRIHLSKLAVLVVAAFICVFSMLSIAGVKVASPNLGGTNQINSDGEIFLFSEVGDYVSWGVTVGGASRPGAYTIALSYSSPYGNKFNSLYVNDVKSSSIYFPQGDGTLKLSVFLNTGLNKIDIRYDQGDWGYIVLKGLKVELKGLRLEAENADITSDLFVVEDFVASGARRVGMVDSGELTWRFNVAVSGNYYLQFGYVSPWDSKVQSLIIDGDMSMQQSIVFPQSSSYTTTNYLVYLTEGKHSVSIKKDWGHMAFDYLEVVKE